VLAEQQEQAAKVERMIKLQRDMMTKLAAVKDALPKDKLTEMVTRVKAHAASIKEQQAKLAAAVTSAQRAIAAAQASIASAASAAAAHDAPEADGVATDRQLLASLGDTLARSGGGGGGEGGGSS